MDALNTTQKYRQIGFSLCPNDTMVYPYYKGGVVRGIPNDYPFLHKCSLCDPLDPAFSNDMILLSTLPTAPLLLHGIIPLYIQFHHAHVHAYYEAHPYYREILDYGATPTARLWSRIRSVLLLALLIYALYLVIVE